MLGGPTQSGWYANFFKQSGPDKPKIRRPGGAALAQKKQAYRHAYRHRQVQLRRRSWWQLACTSFYGVALAIFLLACASLC